VPNTAAVSTSSRIDAGGRDGSPSFLQSSTFFTIAAATGTIPACRAMPDMGALTDKGHYVFAQGVASGDPRDESIVF